jgi:hypothetical protein
MLEFRRLLCRNPNVKSRHILVSTLCFALAACGQLDAAPAAQGAATDAAATPARNKRLTAQDIARIEATGKTGIWTDTTEICSKNARRGVRATLLWNVKGQADKVVIVLVGRNEKQRNFGAGGPVGQRETGPWVRPGMTFKLLKADDQAELGSVSFTEGANCGK